MGLYARSMLVLTILFGLLFAIFMVTAVYFYSSIVSGASRW